MKKLAALSLTLLAQLFFMSSAYTANEPIATQGEMWEYVINNAYRVADHYATNRNPSSTFISANKDYRLVKQYGGEFVGQYLLVITNEQGRDVSYARLKPLFDVSKPSDDLDDSEPLWEVVDAKFNGIPY